MPTMRLDGQKRRQIKRQFNTVLQRALNNKEFPLGEDDIKEFGLSLLPPKDRECYEFLQEHNRSLVTHSGFCPDFKVRNDTYEYCINLYDQELPQDDMSLPLSHPAYQDVCAWAMWYNKTEKDVTNATRYLDGVIENCSSVGQIKRILQEEILRFVPDIMTLSLKNAERTSRMPRGFLPDKEKLEHLANTLALGTLSPEEKSGIRASLGNTRTL